MCLLIYYRWLAFFLQFSFILSGAQAFETRNSKKFKKNCDYDAHSGNCLAIHMNNNIFTSVLHIHNTFRSAVI